jgi:hypothetical protein
MGNMPGMNMPGMEMKKPQATAKKGKAHRKIHRQAGAKKPNSMQAMPRMASPPSGQSNPAQSMPGMNMPGMAAPNSGQAAQQAMPGMGTGGMGGMPMTGLFGSYPMSRDASGTSWQPDDAEHQGIHLMTGDWVYGIYDNQSGPRGDDKFFPAGMFMGMARRDFGATDTISLRAMLSPEPFMGRRGYPLLLQSGETANGTTPLVDRQHPHDLFMELSATYIHHFTGDDAAFVYFGYPGEPALGPPAFMHRASGMDDPAAPITHHWLDSTHIAFGVATAGFVHDDWKIEVSQFTGREPDEHRFDFDPARFDSTSVRVSFNPDEHWSLQTSYGHLHSPEQLDPTVNEDRYTASASYATKFGDNSSLAATIAWGLKSLSNGVNLNGALIESEYKPADPWTIFARLEWDENNELAPGGCVRSASELSLGGIHDWSVSEHWKLGVGALYAFDFAPSVVPSYGGTPHGVMAFVRIGAR